MKTILLGVSLSSAFFRWQKVLVILVVICGFGAINVQASIIVGWDFSTLTGGIGNWGPSPLSPTDNDPNSTIGGLTRGSGITTPGASSSASHAWGGTGFATANNTEALAVAANQDFSFSITANSGYQLSLTTIDAYNIRRSGTGPSTGIWQYSVGGGSFTDIGSAITWGSITSSAGNSESAIDLSGISALQNVAGGTTVTFQVVDWLSTSTAGTWYFNDPSGTTADDLSFEGTISAVPEPATWGVISALALLGICGLREWRQKRQAKAA